MSEDFGYKDNAGLNWIRALSAIAVVIAHTEAWWNAALGIERTYFLRPAGLIAVEAFFVLSGILLGPILFRLIHRNRDVVTFIVRRWYRTLPLYYLALAAHWYIDGSPKGPTPHCYLAFCQNLISPMPQFFSVSWSLTVEEWFYFLAPLTMVLVSKFDLRAITRYRLSLSLIILMSVLLRFSGLLEQEHWDSEIRKIAVVRLDAIAWGALLVSFPRVKWAPALSWSFIASVYVGLSFLFGGTKPATDVFTASAVFVLLPILLSLLVLRTAETAQRHLPPIDFLASLSYPLYLFHVVIMSAFTANRVPFSIATILAFYVLALGVAYVIHNVIEKPIMAMRPGFSDPIRAAHST